jgi:hypothetical protein
MNRPYIIVVLIRSLVLFAGAIEGRLTVVLRAEMASIAVLILQL